MRLIHLINSTFLSRKNTLLSDAYVPVQITAQQRVRYSSQQLAATCIAAERCLQYYLKLL